MKPHPRLRKTVKWGGSVVVLLLISVFIANLWWSALYMGSRLILQVECGRVALFWFDAPLSGYTGPLIIARDRADWCWWPEYAIDPKGTMIGIPQWLLVVLALIATINAWRLDGLAAMWARVGACHKCKYSRFGLPADAACPECGAPAPPASN